MFYNISFIQTFLCSEAVLGLSGVVFMLAGVAATGEEEFFSIISAGIFFYRKYPTKPQQIMIHWCRTMNMFSLRYSKVPSRFRNPEIRIKLQSVRAKRSQQRQLPGADAVSLSGSPRVACIYISHCTRTARVKLPKLSFPQ